jgi:hypothetical protein
MFSVCFWLVFRRCPFQTSVRTNYPEWSFLMGFFHGTAEIIPEIRA